MSTNPTAAWPAYRLQDDAIYNELQSTYQLARAADPFHADVMLIECVPRLNTSTEHTGLVSLLEQLLSSGPRANHLSPGDAWAALRDLGFVMGAMRRWGTEPTKATPKLTRYLLELADQAQCQHPRDNVFTMAVANPQDERMRTYTDSPAERAFIESIEISMITMDKVIMEIAGLFRHPLHDAGFAACTRHAAATFQAVIDALLDVRKKVAPDWFANVFTRNLQPVTIDGQAYHGPSADQTQMLLIDWFLYGQCYPEYMVYFHSLEQHLRPQHRRIMAHHRTTCGESLLAVVRTRYTESMRKNADQTADAMASIIILLKRIRTFRYPHRKMAMDSFAMRDEDHQIGSGGLKPGSDLLKLIDWTEQAMAEFQALVPKH